MKVIELESACADVKLSPTECITLEGYELPIVVTTHAGEELFLIVKIPQVLNAIGQRVDKL